MNTGIYEIRNTANGKRYVGSAVSLRSRLQDHRGMLRRGNHHSRHLQRAWEKHGENAFEFRKLLICSKTNLLLYEQRAIDRLTPEYNICRVAGNALGVKWTMESRARKAAANLGRKHSPETRAKISALMIGNTRNKGKKCSPETRARVVASLLGNTRLKGTKRDPAASAKAAETNRGRKRSPEIIARLSIASRAAWVRRKQRNSSASLLDDTQLAASGHEVGFGATCLPSHPGASGK